MPISTYVRIIQILCYKGRFDMEMNFSKGVLPNSEYILYVT